MTDTLTTPRQRTQEFDARLGAALRQRRILLGISQQELADAIRCSFQQVQKYERGANRISCSALDLMARRLQTSACTLMQAAGTASASGVDDPREAALRRFTSSKLGQTFAAAWDRCTEDERAAFTALAEAVCAARRAS